MVPDYKVPAIVCALRVLVYAESKINKLLLCNGLKIVILYFMVFLLYGVRFLSGRLD